MLLLTNKHTQQLLLMSSFFLFVLVTRKERMHSSFQIKLQIPLTVAKKKSRCLFFYCVCLSWTYGLCDSCKVLQFSNRSNNHLDDDIVLARVVQRHLQVVGPSTDEVRNSWLVYKDKEGGTYGVKKSCRHAQCPKSDDTLRGFHVFFL